MNLSYIILAIYIITIIFIFSQNQEINDRCPRDIPLSNKDGEEHCFYGYYDENKHLISNSIIKDQWLNRRNPIDIHETRFMNSDFSSNGDLIIESFLYSYESINIRFLYGIKKNGRPFFYDEKNNAYIYSIKIETENCQKFESQLIKINLIGENKKDYYISPSFSKYLDVIDIYDRHIIIFSQENIFGISTLSSKYFSILKLTNEDKDKTYLFCFFGEYSE